MTLLYGTLALLVGLVAACVFAAVLAIACGDEEQLWGLAELVPGVRRRR